MANNELREERDKHLLKFDVTIRNFPGSTTNFLDFLGIARGTALHRILENWVVRKYKSKTKSSAIITMHDQLVNAVKDVNKYFINLSDFDDNEKDRYPIGTMVTSRGVTRLSRNSISVVCDRDEDEGTLTLCTLDNWDSKAGKPVNPRITSPSFPLFVKRVVESSKTKSGFNTVYFTFGDPEDIELEDFFIPSEVCRMILTDLFASGEIETHARNLAYKEKGKRDKVLPLFENVHQFVNKWNVDLFKPGSAAFSLSYNTLVRVESVFGSDLTCMDTQGNRGSLTLKTSETYMIFEE